MNHRQVRNINNLGNYVDDRLLWAASREALVPAMRDIREIDDRIGSVWNAQKGKVFAINAQEPDDLEEPMAFAGRWCTEFIYVGIEYSTDINMQATRHRPIKMLRSQTALARLKAIRQYCSPGREAALQVRKLVTPLVSWGGQWRSTSMDTKLALEIENSVWIPACDGKVTRHSLD